ncbi:MAG: hypothetical protein GX847_07910, partial [Clostridiales bacterium]|nr:hypothetical protein [Clostridiales bacterium]
TYRWQRSSTRNGTYTDITGAISSTYVLTASDINFYIRVVATGSGPFDGELTSAGVGPVPEISGQMSGDLELESELDLESDLDLESELNPDSELSLEKVRESEPELDSDLESDSEPEPEPEPELQPELEPELELETKPEPESENAPQAAPEPLSSVLSFSVTPSAPPSSNASVDAAEAVNAHSSVIRHEEPVTDNFPQVTLIENDEYTAAITWVPAAENAGTDAAYVAIITITANTEYTLTGVTADFLAVTGAVSASYSGNTGILTVVF